MDIFLKYQDNSLQNTSKSDLRARIGWEAKVPPVGFAVTIYFYLLNAIKKLSQHFS